MAKGYPPEFRRRGVRVRNPDSIFDQRFFYHPAMLFLLYLIVKVTARLLALGRSNGSSSDLEILVLQHQVRVLQRKAGRPRLRPLDRAVMPRRVGPFLGSDGSRSSGPRRRSCDGTASWCGGSGRTDVGGAQGDLRSTPRYVN
jgi:hypothetical protein